MIATPLCYDQDDNYHGSEDVAISSGTESSLTRRSLSSFGSFLGEAEDDDSPSPQLFTERNVDKTVMRELDRQLSLCARISVI